KKENERLQQDITDLREKILESNSYYKSLTKKKEKLEETITLQKYIDLESKRLANDEFLTKLNDLNIEKEALDLTIKDLTNTITKLKKAQKARIINIHTRYSEILNDINLMFKSPILENTNFFNFQEIKGSGMDNNKTMLALYITY
ncbi:TPA: hypothetical protein H1608_002844, partial [Listeria monocytogenes]|nr:hypothetical protein [Listeria monocytogenes]